MQRRNFFSYLLSLVCAPFLTSCSQLSPAAVVPATPRKGTDEILDITITGGPTSGAYSMPGMEDSFVDVRAILSANSLKPNRNGDSFDPEALRQAIRGMRAKLTPWHEAHTLISQEEWDEHVKEMEARIGPTVRSSIIKTSRSVSKSTSLRPVSSVIDVEPGFINAADPQSPVYEPGEAVAPGIYSLWGHAVEVDQNGVMRNYWGEQWPPAAHYPPYPAPYPTGQTHGRTNQA